MKIFGLLQHARSLADDVNGAVWKYKIRMEEWNVTRMALHRKRTATLKSVAFACAVE
jgi:hypothetical protein